MRRSKPSGRALAVALTVFGPPEPVIDVTWEAPAACPDTAAARAEIAARLADRPGRDVRAVARVRALHDGTWQVAVELHTADGTATRTLQAATCAEALTATAVVLAIAVEPTQEAEVGVPLPPPTETASVEPTDVPSVERVAVEPPSSLEPPGPTAGEAAERSPTAEASPAPAAGRPLGISAGARAGLAHGALPSPAAFVAASAGVHGRRWFVQAGPLHRIRTETSVSLPQPAGGRFRLTAGQLLAGPRLRWGVLELPLGAGVEVGAIWARGTGAVDPISVRRLWTAAVAHVGLGWAPRETLGLHVGVDGVVPLLRPLFTLGEQVEVLTVGPASVRAWIGAVWRFSL